MIIILIRGRGLKYWQRKRYYNQRKRIGRIRGIIYIYIYIYTYTHTHISISLSLSIYIYIYIYIYVYIYKDLRSCECIPKCWLWVHRLTYTMQNGTELLDIMS